MEHLSENKKNGFTLLEVILSLTFLSVLLLLTVPLSFKLYDSIQQQYFFKEFEQDVLWLQKRSITEQDIDYLTIDVAKHRYYISDTASSGLKKSKSFPPSWKVDLRTFQNPLYFSFLGQNRFPGTFELTTTLGTYKFIFPLGKGRLHIEKTS
ncbi:competence type IV pilus minor pilin ComGD [Bacillaceae bacterium S4-13-58]